MNELVEVLVPPGSDGRNRRTPYGRGQYGTGGTELAYESSEDGDGGAVAVYSIKEILAECKVPCVLQVSGSVLTRSGLAVRKDLSNGER